MPTAAEMKAAARRLRSHLQARHITLSHAASLEAIAAVYGFRDWNTASASHTGELDDAQNPYAGVEIRYTMPGRMPASQGLRTPSPKARNALRQAAIMRLFNEAGEKVAAGEDPAAVLDQLSDQFLSE